MKITFAQIVQLVALIGAIALFVLHKPVEASILIGIAIGQHMDRPFPAKAGEQGPTPHYERVRDGTPVEDTSPDRPSNIGSER